MADILVVDDEAAVRGLVAETLELAGHEVVAVASGAEALAAVTIHRPDCVVLDVMMPGMSGLEVLAELRAEPSTADLPVVMLSARADDASTWKGWSAGASLYLTKPFDPLELQAQVDRLLGEDRAAAQQPEAAADPAPRQLGKRVLYDELRSL